MGHVWATKLLIAAIVSAQTVEVVTDASNTGSNWINTIENNGFPFALSALLIAGLGTGRLRIVSKDEATQLDRIETTLGEVKTWQQHKHD